jgi:hypothetical protein
LRGARAQSFMLLRRADEACEEVRRIEDIMRVMRTEPRTLVAAMIYAAVAGLQTQMIEEGFAAGLWREPHWRGFQTPNRIADLQDMALQSLRTGERAGVLRLMEFDGSGLGNKSSGNLWGLIPRGWLEQNAALYARLMQTNIEMWGLQGASFDRRRIQELQDSVGQAVERKSPMNMLSRLAIPSLSKARQQTARQQTGLNQVRVAAGLERHRQAHGAYPEALAALAPDFLDENPADLIGGQPLRYQRRANGEYALHSPGWDGIDDLAPWLADTNASMKSIFARPAAERDWVWKGVPENLARPAGPAPK